MTYLTTELDYWKRAERTAAGICIETDNATRLIQRLYQARRAAFMPELAELSVVQSPVNPLHVWIVRRKAA